MARINLYSLVGQGDFFSAGLSGTEFFQQLTAAKPDEEIELHIHSDGGDALDGMMIANVLSDHKGRKVAIIDGTCASAATFAAMACDTIKMRSSALMMIHGAWSDASGQPDKLREKADQLDKVITAMRPLYERRNVPSDKIDAWMASQETWFTAAEAKAEGLIDEILEMPALPDPKAQARRRRANTASRAQASRNRSKAMDPKEIRSKLGLAEDAKAREVRKALKAYMSEDKGTDDEKSALARAVAEMDEESETDVGKSQVSAKAAESAEAMALIDKLTARVEKAETDAYYAKAEQLQDRKTAKEVLALAGGNTSNALAILAKMPKQPNTTSALARRMFQGGDPMSGQTTKTTDDDDGDNIRPSANRQFTLTQCNLASKAKALAEAKNISIEQATYEVAKKHPELAQRAQ
jgi:ATP-dependent protease ClpP protease subunit